MRRSNDRERDSGHHRSHRTSHEKRSYNSSFMMTPPSYYQLPHAVPHQQPIYYSPQMNPYGYMTVSPVFSPNFNSKLPYYPHNQPVYFSGSPGTSKYTIGGNNKIQIVQAERSNKNNCHGDNKKSKPNNDEINQVNLNKADMAVSIDADGSRVVKLGESYVDTYATKSFSSVTNKPKDVDKKTGVQKTYDRRRKFERRKSTRPWRGYIVEDKNIDRHFRSAGHHTCYFQDTNNKENTLIKENLLELHHKFILHRISIDQATDDSVTSQEKKLVHPSIPYNEIIEQSEPRTCGCDEEQIKIGIHHGIYPDREPIPRCDLTANNGNKLHHYRLVITPEVNFVTRDPTTIYYEGKDFCFEGFSLFTHSTIDMIPPYLFMRNCVDYTVKFVKETYMPEGFCIKDLDLVCDYLFADILELLEWNYKESGEGCRQFHLMPRFVHRLTDLTGEDQNEISEILAMSEVLEYLIDSVTPFSMHENRDNYKSADWKDISRSSHGALIINPNQQPRAIRVDEVVKSTSEDDKEKFISIIHSTPTARISARTSTKEYNDLCDRLNKVKRAVRSRAVPRKEDQEMLLQLQEQVDHIRIARVANKWNEVEINTEGYFNSGLRWDICQHSSYLPNVWNYLTFMSCLPRLEKNIGYQFQDKSLLKTALTHSSYLDQSSLSLQLCNTIQNLGKRHPHIEKTVRPESLGVKKKGVLNMTNAMSTLFDCDNKKSSCQYNERLEFLGDAVLDYLSSLHLFFMFPDKGPGKLTAFRSGLVQTENLTQIAKKMELDHFLLVQHRSKENERFEHYLANAVESVIGAVLLDGGLTAVDNLLSSLLFCEDKELSKIWKTQKLHPLQEDFEDGDRHLINTSKVLTKFTEFESKVGIKFKHIRLLAKAFTHSANGLDNIELTKGNYERLEFLGDAILKFICSDYLYKHFPTHQEGHLTLLRSSMVNAQCLAKAANELDMNKYIIYQSKRDANSIKDRVVSDVFEAFLGAVHIDQGYRYCYKLVEICVLSKLRECIINQEWLDPKSQLQQCCDSLRDPNKSINPESQEHPIYKRLKENSHEGAHFFKVAVYYNNKRLGTGTGSNCKDAEKDAARDALKNNYFEQHARQKRIAYRKFGRVDTKRLPDNLKQKYAKARSREHRNVDDNKISNQEKQIAANDTVDSDSPIRKRSQKDSFSEDSDEGLETLESSDDSEFLDDSELYESIFNV